MKLIKTLAASLLVSTLAFSTAHAAEKKAGATKPTAEQIQNEKNLKQFNDSVGIIFKSRQIGKDQKGQDVLVLGYEVENKNTKRDIRSVEFISVYTVNNQAVWGIPLKFEEPLKRKSKTTISVIVPLTELPEQAKTLFLDNNTPIGTINGAKELVFSNGTKITVK